MQRPKYNFLNFVHFPEESIKVQSETWKFSLLTCIIALSIQSMSQTWELYIKNYLNRDECCEITQKSVPEDPSVGLEVSFQPLGTAEVCKERHIFRKTKGDNK